MPWPPTGRTLTVSWGLNGKADQGQVFIQGGKTCAESPQRMTRPTAHSLQLRAENRKGLDRSVSIQSAGKVTSAVSLRAVKISPTLTENEMGAASYPYRFPGCTRYGCTTSLIISGDAMCNPSSCFRTTNSNLHKRSPGRPKRPQTEGRSGLHRKRKSGGKKRS